jgi:hypothetical protein
MSFMMTAPNTFPRNNQNTTFPSYSNPTHFCFNAEAGSNTDYEVEDKLKENMMVKNFFMRFAFTSISFNDHQKCTRAFLPL